MKYNFQFAMIKIFDPYKPFEKQTNVLVFTRYLLSFALIVFSDT